MLRKMKIDYYQVELPKDETKTFETLIKSVADSADDRTRNEKYNHVPFRLQEAHESGSLWIGNMVKIRMDGIPPKTKLTGEQEDIDLDDDEGLGEETAFLYDPKTKILVTQRNRFAVSTSAFARYWVLRCGIDVLSLNPVLRSDAMKRMEQMRVHRKLEVSVAGLNNMQIFQNQGKGVGALVDLSTEFKAPIVSIAVSMGHNKGTLAKVKDYADKLMKAVNTSTSSRNQKKSGAVTKILVSGKEGDDEPTEVVDLLEDRMMDIVKVDMSRDHNAFRQTRQDALQQAFNDRKVELEQMFSKPKG